MGRRINSKAIHRGRHADQGTLKDDRYLKCTRCGFVCHLDRDQSASRGSTLGAGVKYPEKATFDQLGVTFDGEDDNWGCGMGFDGRRNDLKVEQGCPLCGTFLYRG